jgi:hypothetical protein
VNLALGLGEKGKGFEGEGLSGCADRGAGDDFADFGEATVDVGGFGLVDVGWGGLVRVGVRLVLSLVAVRMLSFVLVRVSWGVFVSGIEVEGAVGTAVDEDIDFGGGDSGALDAMGRQLSLEAEGAGNFFELLQRDASVYGCAEKHVATDSGETIQVGNPHYESDGRWPELLV